MSRLAARTTGLGVAAMAAVAAATTTGLVGLNGDVTYTLGGIETAGRGGVSVFDVFVARPLVYRLLLDGLDAVRRLLVPDGSRDVAHLLIRAETAVLIAAVAAVLFFGLRRFLGTRPAATAAGATALALIVAPPWHFLEPDWVAALAAALAVGAAGAPRRWWVGALLGGLAAVTAVTVKLATAPIALLALLLVATLDRRRAVWAAAATAVFAVIWYAVTRQLLPWEWIWLQDQASLVADAPIHHGLRWADIRELLIGTGDVAIVCPVVAAAPAAAAALIRRRPPGRPRWIATGAAVLAAGLAVASAYGQGEFFSYHFAVVPVLAGGVWGAAVGLCPSARVALISATALLTPACVVLMKQPDAWRAAHVGAVTSAVAVAAGLAALAVVVATAAGGRHAPVLWVVAAVVLAATLVQPVIPGVPYSFGTYNYDIRVRRPWDDSGWTALSERMGRDTPVLYLTFGTYNHLIGNPTSCRYPSPQWLQRGSAIPRVRAYRSYADNFRCLTDDRQARFLVWQPLWFPVRRGTPQVWQLLNERFDCSSAALVPAPAPLVVCPARV